MRKNNGQGEYIVVDIESNKFGESSEIIQLSAVRVKSQNFKDKNSFGTRLTIADSFDKYVKNTHPVSKEISKLTGITEDTLQNAEEFSKVFNDFKQWTYKNTNNVFVVMWGNRDKVFLDRNCQHYRLPKFNEEFLDLQQFIKIKKNIKKLPSLESQVTKYLGDFKGQTHNSLDDALNLANLLVKVMEETLPANNW